MGLIKVSPDAKIQCNLNLVTSNFLRLLKRYEIVVIGDREFRSVELAYWLKNKKVKFALRQKQDTYICPKGGNYQLLSELGLAPGMKFFYSGVTYTKKPGFSEKAWVPLVANLHSQHMRDFQQIYSQLTRVNQSQLTQNKKDSSFEL